MKNHLTALALLLILLSCGKTEDDVFYAGTTEGVDITILDKTIGSPTPPECSSCYEINLDPDHDGINDLYITGVFVRSPGGLNYKYSNIKPLNPQTFISSVAEIDTLHQCNEPIDETWMGKILYYDSAYECTGNDSIYRVDTNELTSVHSYLDKAENIRWDNSEIYFSYWDQFRGMSGFSLIVMHYIYLGKWNNIGNKYVLFKIVKDDRERLGWIELYIADHSQIHLVKMAIEK